MVSAEKTRALFEVAQQIAEKRETVEVLRRKRNDYQTRCHEAQTELRHLETQRSRLLVEIGVPLIVTNDPSRELLDGILKLIEGVTCP